MVVGNLERFNLVSVGGQTLWTLGSTWFVGLVFLPIQLHSFQSRWHKPLHVLDRWGFIFKYCLLGIVLSALKPLQLKECCFHKHSSTLAVNLLLRCGIGKSREPQPALFVQAACKQHAQTLPKATPSRLVQSMGYHGIWFIRYHQPDTLHPNTN